MPTKEQLELLSANSTSYQLRQRLKAAEATIASLERRLAAADVFQWIKSPHGPAYQARDTKGREWCVFEIGGSSQWAIERPARLGGNGVLPGSYDTMCEAKAAAESFAEEIADTCPTWRVNAEDTEWRAVYDGQEWAVFLAETAEDMQIVAPGEWMIHRIHADTDQDWVLDRLFGTLGEAMSVAHEMALEEQKP